MKTNNSLYKVPAAIAIALFFFASCKKTDDTFNTIIETPVNESTNAVENSSRISAAAARVGLVFESSFEGSNPFSGLNTSQSATSYGITASTVRVKDGSQSFRTEVRKADASVSGGYRAELTGFPADNGDRWYGYSTYFESIPLGGGHVIQWHPDNGTGSANLSLWTGDGRFMVVRNPSGTNQNTYQSGTTSIVAGKWYDMVWHVKWSSGSDGIIELWIDGAKYFTYNGITAQTGVYLKFGQNRWTLNNDGIVYYDNLRIGGSSSAYADVAPGTGSTPPPPPPPPGNQSPVVSAGSDKTITLPVNSVTLTATASDPDGSIASYLWTKSSGPNATIRSSTSASSRMENLVAGSYIFNMKVTDNKGATANSTVNVYVLPSGGTPPPPPPGNYGTLSYSTGYDNSSDVNTQQGLRNTLSTSFYKTGPGSFRSEVRAADQSTSGGYRGEMQYNGSSQNPTEGVIEYDVYYENWQNWGNDGGHSVQWHPTNSGSATLALYNYNGKFKVTRNLGGSNYHQSGTLKTVNANTWYKLRWEVKWSSSTSGYIRMYIDNVLYYSYTGITMNSTTGMPYLKIGQNRWSMNAGHNTVVYYDNLKIYRK